MPTYEFLCDQCHTRFEAQLHFGESSEHVHCPQGHAQTRRLFTPPGIVFKGSGFYVTDNRKRSGKKNA